VANPRVVGSLPPELAESDAILSASGIRSVIDAPLRSSGEVIGVLGFASTDERKIWPSELPRLAQIAADMFANAIERVRSEGAVRAHLEQLAHVQRLGTMGQLASGMAHELNQPLAAIMNYVHACERRIDSGRIDADSLRTAVRAIGSQATRAADVIKALRALVKSEARREYEDLDTLVGDALRLLETEGAKKRIRVHFQPADASTRVHVDVIQIQQVVLNLLQNAFDAIDASDAQIRAVYVSIRACGSGGVEVSVRDTGPGIERGKAETVFEDFYTSKPQGLGLGLSISRSLIEAHGGRLWLDTSMVPGACFRFTLPVSSE
jgi:two-component system sensor histidine kinase TtrS